MKLDPKREIFNKCIVIKQFEREKAQIHIFKDLDNEKENSMNLNHKFGFKYQMLVTFIPCLM